MTASSPQLLHAALTKSVIGAFYVVYNALGFGFLEAVYVAALTIELRKRGHTVAREVMVRVYYDGVPVGWYRADMLVDGVLVVETKSTFRLDPTWARQLGNLLRASDLELGLLLHFGPSPKYYRFISTINYQKKSAP